MSCDEGSTLQHTPCALYKAVASCWPTPSVQQAPSPAWAPCYYCRSSASVLSGLLACSTLPTRVSTAPDVVFPCLGDTPNGPLAGPNLPKRLRSYLSSAVQSVAAHRYTHKHTRTGHGSFSRSHDAGQQGCMHARARLCLGLPLPSCRLPACAVRAHPAPCHCPSKPSS